LVCDEDSDFTAVCSVMEAVIEVAPTGDPLSINWMGDRDDIFNPVRGALATFSFYASTVNQFDEFFGASNKDYRMHVYYKGSLYWTGWMMLDEYMESLNYPPYEVTLLAYDLGFLQNEVWDVSDVADQTIHDILRSILDSTGMNLSMKDCINVFEDSLTSAAASDDMIDHINMKAVSLIDDSWVGLNLYEALGRILRPFNAFVVQEDVMWNVCRVGDMKWEHWFRVFNQAGAITSSGTEDRVVDISDYKLLNRSALLMSALSYKKLNATFDRGLVDLVNNSANNRAATVGDYWTRTAGSGSISYQSGTFKPYPTVRYQSKPVIRINSLASGTTVFTHNEKYAIAADTKFDIEYFYEVHGDSNTSTKIAINVELNVSGTVYYLDWTDGTWSTTSTVAEISYSSTTHTYGFSDSFQTDATPGAGTLTIRLKEANWSGLTGYTFYQLSILPSVIVDDFRPATQDYSETINSDNLEDLNLALYYGDTNTSKLDLLAGSLSITSGGAATDSWQAKAGGAADGLLDIAIDCYRAQHEGTARKLQALIMGEIDYLNVLQDSLGRRFLASSIVRNFSHSTLEGEWTEIKTGWGDELVTSFDNDGTRPFDTFTSSGNVVSSAIKSHTSDSAIANVNDIDTTNGLRYKIEVVITGTLSGNIQLQFDSDAFNFTEIGTYVNHIVSDMATGTQTNVRIVAGLATTFDGSITLSIKEAEYGL
jgi:hypothetical protein